MTLFFSVEQLVTLALEIPQAEVVFGSEAAESIAF